jgi:hypothetical protein
LLLIKLNINVIQDLALSRFFIITLSNLIFAKIGIMYQNTKLNVMSLFVFNIFPTPYLLLLCVQKAAPLASYNIRKMGRTKCKYLSLAVLLDNNLIINTLRYLLFYNVKVPVLLGKIGTFVLQYRLFYMLKQR